MDTKFFDAFVTDFTELRERYNIHDYFLALLTSDAQGELSDLPIMSEMHGNRAQNVSPARVTALMLEHMLKAQIRLLMMYNGLTLPQAVGAVQESTKAAAHELQMGQNAFMQQATQGSVADSGRSVAEG